MFWQDIFQTKTKEIPLKDMTDEDIFYLRQNLNFLDMMAPENIELFKQYTIQGREEFAYETNSLVFYLPHEATEAAVHEDKAAMRAAPQGFKICALNGLNVGCGGRYVNKHLIPIDIMRSEDVSEPDAHNSFISNALLANPDDLPFQSGTLDYIVSLHMLEHVTNPVEVSRHWHDLLKPGGGIGLILPNFRYTWNAATDTTKFGHKWNPEPSKFSELYENSLKDLFVLEHFNTLERKISFDVVLRKPGKFEPFKISESSTIHTGADLFKSGKML